MERYLGVKEIAGIYGVRPKLIYEWVKTGKIPAEAVQRAGLRLRFDPEIIKAAFQAAVKKVV